MDSQQRITLKHMELCSILCGSLDERGVWGRTDPCICMVEFLRCSPEIITSLLIGYIPIQNKKLKKLKKKKRKKEQSSSLKAIAVFKTRVSYWERYCPALGGRGRCGAGRGRPKNEQKKEKGFKCKTEVFIKNIKENV